MIAPRLIGWWTTLPPVVRAPYWPGVVVALVAVVLLLVFYQVVSASVQASALRHQTAAVQDKATARCKTMGVQPARDDCLSQVKVLISQTTRSSS